MSKGVPPEPKYCKSVFTLTFAVEILGIDVWHDCNEGWLDLGPCTQGMKIQYQLYPGYTFDADILIWPHSAKIWCGGQYGWVRTWQFLQRRWLAFSIRHAVPVRVLDFTRYVVNVSLSVGMGVLGVNAKNDKTLEVYLPPISFGTKRYFAPVIENEETLQFFMQSLIWDAVVEYIPVSFLDGVFDTPYPVSDVRHQDAVLDYVRDIILNSKVEEEDSHEGINKDVRGPKGKDKDKDVKKKGEVQKFEIKLLGETILAGAGRITKFEISGERPPDVGEIVTLISSQNLPAYDDLPIMFVNINKLVDVPYVKFEQHNITHLYTKWTMKRDSYLSEPQALINTEEIDFNAHHVAPLFSNTAGESTAPFLEYTFEIQLRGVINNAKPKVEGKLFGYADSDISFGKTPPPEVKDKETDVLIAVTKIDARQLAKGLNMFIRGDYPLYPPTTEVQLINRGSYCTNDVNVIGASAKPVLVVPNHVILEAQMTIEASIGLVGCRPPKLFPCFSRLWLLATDPTIVLNILERITEINQDLASAEKTDNLLTGFCLDTGDVAILYLEGFRDGEILNIWEMTENYYPNVKPIFSSSSRYPSRIYNELLGISAVAVPFVLLKMYAPLSALLACPSVYAKPAMPLPTKSAVLKVGRLLSIIRNRSTPRRSDMPTMAELRSFRLELCVPPRSVTMTSYYSDAEKMPLKQVPSARMSTHDLKGVNWRK